MKNYHQIPFYHHWLYVKIYCNPLFSNEILTDLHRILTTNETKASAWYFIRYYDKDSHLRVRFYHEKKEDSYHTYQSIAPYLNDLVLNDCINSIAIETYQPEIFRYGLHTFNLCEELFCVETTVLIEEILQNRDQLFFNIHKLLMNYVHNFHLPDSAAFISKSIQIFENEFSVDKKMKKNIATILRSHKDAIVFHNVSTKQLAKVLEIQAKLTSVQEKTRVLRSLIHMLINRAYENSQRKHELLHYYALDMALKISKKHIKTASITV